MTDGAAPQAPAPEPERGRGWRTHPLAKRLVLLVLVGVGVWLWQVTGTPRREVVWQFDGFGWGEVRAIDFQVERPDGTLVEREEHFFGPAGPPPSLTLEWELPAGQYRTLVFVKREGQEERTPLVEPLALGDEAYIVRRLRLPANR